MPPNGGTQRYDKDKAPILKQITEADLSATAITLGAGVDPDGLAAQMACAAMIKQINEEAKIGLFYRGDFDHPQNATMKQLLGINNLITYAEYLDEEWTTKISMDGPASVVPFVPDFIIDHHEQTEDPTIAADVRMIGSCSAIAWEYLMESGYNWESEDAPKIATALALGIDTDTRHGAETSCSPLDYEALAFCQIHKDDKLYREILNYPKPAYYMEAKVKGWTNKVREEQVLVTSIGVQPSKRIWLVPALAEEFHTISGVETSIVFALVDGDIRISVRSSNPSLTVNDFMNDAFQSGGGKRGAGAATIEMPFLLHQLTDDHAVKGMEFYSEVIIHRALQVAGGGVRQSKEES